MKRTDTEIRDQIDAIMKAGTDPYWFERNALICYLPFYQANRYLGRSSWQSYISMPRVRASYAVEQHLFGYMQFAWGKANGCRGLATMQMIYHIRAWMFMLGYKIGPHAFLDYRYYGKPLLRAVCNNFGWDWTQWDDGRWRRDEFSDYVTPDQVPDLELNI